MFSSAQPVNLADLQKALGVETAWVEELLETLNSDYASQGRGLRIYRHNNTCQLVTAPEVAPYVEKFLGIQSGARLSAAALETLTIIAYRQPITRQGVETIRGVDSSGVINTLLARGLVEEVGRAETVGHPILLGTTMEFLHYFGLKSLKELPPLAELTETATTDKPVPKVEM